MATSYIQDPLNARIQDAISSAVNTAQTTLQGNIDTVQATLQSNINAIETGLSVISTNNTQNGLTCYFYRTGNVATIRITGTPTRAIAKNGMIAQVPDGYVPAFIIYPIFFNRTTSVPYLCTINSRSVVSNPGQIIASVAVSDSISLTATYICETTRPT